MPALRNCFSIWVVVLALAGCQHDLDVIQRPDASRDAAADMIREAGTPDSPPVDRSPADIPAPDMAAPDMAAPDIPAPDIPAPDLPPPDLSAPDSALPDASGPDGPVKPNPLKGFCSKDNWCWMNPLPQGHTLRGMWGSSATDLFVVGEAGTILRYDGKAWSMMTSGTTERLNGVWGSGSNHVCASTAKGNVLCYDGAKWTSYSTAIKDSLGAIWGSGPKDIFAVGAGWWCISPAPGSSRRIRG